MQPGSFVWYDVMTTDAGAAEAFYSRVVGWGMQDSGTPGMHYTLLVAEGIPVGGLMPIPDESRAAGARPCWTGYIGVTDVDATVAKALSLGGSVRVPAQDIAGVGRFAVINDPQGAAIALVKWNVPAAGDAPLAPGTPGRTGWHELATTDWSKAFDFYSTLFGWRKGEPHDMGPMGTYQLFSLDGGEPIGGMFNKPAEMPGPFWMYYFNVGDIDAAEKRLSEAGGKVLNGPMQVPGDMWIIQCQDPQGAMFAMLGSRAAA